MSFLQVSLLEENIHTCKGLLRHEFFVFRIKLSFGLINFNVVLVHMVFICDIIIRAFLLEIVSLHKVKNQALCCLNTIMRNHRFHLIAKFSSGIFFTSSFRIAFTISRNVSRARINFNEISCFLIKESPLLKSSGNCYVHFVFNVYKNTPTSFEPLTSWCWRREMIGLCVDTVHLLNLLTRCP